MFSRKSFGSSGAPPSVGGNVGILLTQIASATQQRRLTAVIDDVEVVLDVSNRELMRVISVIPETMPQANAVAIATRDDDRLAIQLEVLGGLLAALSFLEGEMTLSTTSAPLRYSTKLQGFSADELGRATQDCIAKSVGKRMELAVQDDRIQAEVLDVSVPSIAAASETSSLPAAQVPQAIGASGGTPINGDPATDLLFFEQLSGKCEAGLVIDMNGEVLHRANRSELLDDVRTSVVEDLTQWQVTTRKLLPARQFLLLRGSLPSDLSICIMIDAGLITIFALHASSTGRALSAIGAMGL
jgi:hypothetical protein